MADPNRKSDYLSTTRIPEHATDQLVRKTDSYMKDRQTDKQTEYLVESNRSHRSHSESEFDVKPVPENNLPFESKYSKPPSYSKPLGWYFSSFVS